MEECDVFKTKDDDDGDGDGDGDGDDDDRIVFDWKWLRPEIRTSACILCDVPATGFKLQEARPALLDCRDGNPDSLYQIIKDPINGNSQEII